MKRIAPQRRRRGGQTARLGPLARLSLALGGLVLVAPAGGTEPFTASAPAVELDRQLDWRRARLIVVQEAGRYKTLESFARERFDAMYGQEQLPGLSPLASLLDWLFRAEAYVDAPVVRIRDRGLRIHFTETVSDDARQRIRQTGYMTPREFFAPLVQQRIEELEPRNTMVTALRRVRNAQETAQFLAELVRIVPRPGQPADALWFTPAELRANAVLALPESERPPPAELASKFGRPAPGITPQQAAPVVNAWEDLADAWRSGDTHRVQRNLDRLADVLPTLAAGGVYPRESQRLAETHYYAMGKFTGGWMLYVAGAVVAVFALVTRWRVPWAVALVLLVGALAVHAYGLSLRWYILGRIPVANMFEALVASAWVGAAVGLVLELFYRTRVLVLAAHVVGFVTLVVAGYVLPGGGTLTSIMGILDDLMLRIHTVFIIIAYQLIFLAAVVAVVYLIGYYWHVAGRPAPLGPDGAALVTGFMPMARAPVLAGALPSDWGRDARLPAWLHAIDWSHLIILNMAFVLLFLGGIALGALWADYSWGRPWGWDPKETFALNTWLIYAVLIHARFVVQRKGLWTAWLSLLGCAMMAFNWFVVNFYIVGLHSYA